MKLKRIKIENYKNITKMDEKFDGNVFLVKGDNEKGKTTFCRSFLKLVTTTDKAEISVTKGQSHGTIEGQFVDVNGNKYTVILDFTNDKETIRMITPEGVSTSKIGEIKNFFNYSYVDVDEFIAWSSTAEGRRKQRDIVLKLLSEKEIEEFNQADLKEKEYYKKRTEANRELDVARKLYENSIIPDNAKLLLADYKVYEEVYNNAKEKLNGSLKIEADYTILVNSIKVKEDAKNRLLDDKTGLENGEKGNREHLLFEIKSLEEQISNKKKKLEEDTISYGVKIDKVKNELTSVDFEINNLEEKRKTMSSSKPENLKIALEKAEIDFEAVKRVDQSNRLMESNQKEYTEKNRIFTNYSSAIEGIRKVKETIILESNIPIKGLSIDDDGILLNKLPFTKEQISTSQIMTTVFKILIALNKKTPIFYLGRAESLGKVKLDEMLQIAINNDYQVFVDRVESGEELKIEVYEDLTK